MEIELSDHAVQRSAQRNLAYNEIQFIIDHGERTHAAGVIFCQLLRKNIPNQLPGSAPERRLVGSTVVISKDEECVITLYRNTDALHKTRRKTRYNQQKHQSAAQRQHISA